MDTTVDDTEGRKSPEGQATAMLGRKVDSDQRWEDRDVIRTFNLVLTYLLTSVRSIFRGVRLMLLCWWLLLREISM